MEVPAKSWEKVIRTDVIRDGRGDGGVCVELKKGSGISNFVARKASDSISAEVPQRLQS